LTPVKTDDIPNEIARVHKSLKRTSSVVAESPLKSEESKRTISENLENNGDIANIDIDKVTLLTEKQSKRKVTLILPTVPTISNTISPQKSKVVRNLSSDFGVSPIKKPRLSAAFASKTDRFT